jgi:hypothetical protein
MWSDEFSPVLNFVPVIFPESQWCPQTKEKESECECEWKNFEFVEGGLSLVAVGWCYVKNKSSISNIRDRACNKIQFLVSSVNVYNSDLVVEM